MCYNKSRARGTAKDFGSRSGLLISFKDDSGLVLFLYLCINIFYIKIRRMSSFYRSKDFYSIICPKKRSNTAYNARFLGLTYVPTLKFDFYQKTCLFAGLSQNFISIFALFGFGGCNLFLSSL
ncbi:hypothetical protein ES708_07626 [subsurface metagenome]